MAELMDLMQRRRSVRSYTEDPIPEEQLRQILQAGLLSPSGRGRRPWTFLVVRGRETLQKMSQCREGAAGMLAGAAAAIAVLGDTQKTDTYVEDCSIALTQMHLMAASLGLGSCWIQVRMRQAPDGRTAGEYLQEILGFPEHLCLEAILSLGVPARTPAAHELPDLSKEDIRWERY